MTAAAHSHVEELECALAGVVHENNELRAIVRRVREYANWHRQMTNEFRNAGRPYDALAYADTAATLERIIGDRP